MAATYPGNIKVFTVKRNILDIVDAPHVNTLQEEVAAIQTVVGINPHVSTAGGGSSLGAWSTASRTYATLADRLANVEAGLLADTHSQYVRFANAETITGQKTFTSNDTYFGSGAGSSSANVNLRSGTTGGQAAVVFQDGGVPQWQFYKNAGNSTLYLRDLVNARMHITFTPGVGDAAATTTFHSAIHAGGLIRANGSLDLASSSSDGNRFIYTWTSGDPNWRIGMGSPNVQTAGAGASFLRKYATSHVQYIVYGGAATQGFAVGPAGGNSHLEVRGSDGLFYVRNNAEIGGTLDLTGAATLRSSLLIASAADNQFQGDLYLRNTAAATSTAGTNSRRLLLQHQLWDSAAGDQVAFAGVQALPYSNNNPTPQSRLSFQASTDAGLNERAWMAGDGTFTMLGPAGAVNFQVASDGVIHMRGASRLMIRDLEALNGVDSFLRINQGTAFTSGIWFGSSPLRIGSGFLGVGGVGGESTVVIQGSTDAVRRITLNGANGVITAVGMPAGPGFDGYASSTRANTSNGATGGGIVEWLTVGFKFSKRFIVISNGRGTNFAVDGYFNIGPVAAGTVITGVGGATNKTVDANGYIPLASWDALYYILPIGGSNGFVAGNLRVVNYTANLDIPAHWVRVAAHNADGDTLSLCNGATLDRGGVLDMDRGLGRNQFVIRIPHTWHVPGDVKVASGDTDYILPFYLPVPAGQTVVAVGTKVSIRSGTSVVAELRRNNLTTGTTPNGQGNLYGPFTVTTTPAEPGPWGGDFAHGDSLHLVVNSVSGAPRNMTVTVYVDYAV